MMIDEATKLLSRAAAEGNLEARALIEEGAVETIIDAARSGVSGAQHWLDNLIGPEWRTVGRLDKNSDDPRL